VNDSREEKELIPFVKRGSCIAIQGVVVIAYILRDLYSFFEKKKKWGLVRKKLSQEEATKIMKEAASYIYFETVKQISEYQEGNLPAHGASAILDFISGAFSSLYDIDNLSERLEEYRGVENPTYHVSKNTLKIARGKDVDALELMEISIEITGSITFMLFDGIRRMFELSEKDMDGVILDFYTNHFPKISDENRKLYCRYFEYLI